jgi:hypothetical protein
MQAHLSQLISQIDGRSIAILLILAGSGVWWTLSDADDKPLGPGLLVTVFLLPLLIYILYKVYVLCRPPPAR